MATQQHHCLVEEGDAGIAQQRMGHQDASLLWHCPKADLRSAHVVSLAAVRVTHTHLAPCGKFSQACDLSACLQVLRLICCLQCFGASTRTQLLMLTQCAVGVLAVHCTGRSMCLQPWDVAACHWVWQGPASNGIQTQQSRRLPGLPVLESTCDGDWPIAA